MKFHHDFHHQAYINNLNKAMAGKDAASLVSLMPGAKAAKLNNAGGGHYNHCLCARAHLPQEGAILRPESKGASFSHLPRPRSVQLLEHHGPGRGRRAVGHAGR